MPARRFALLAPAIAFSAKDHGADAAEDFVSPVIEFQKTMRRMRMARMDEGGSMPPQSVRKQTAADRAA